MATRAKSTSNGRGGSNRHSSGTVIGAVAAGVVAGLAANLGRKAAVQGITVATGDWLEGLKLEHGMALGILSKIAQTDDTQTKKRATLLMQLKHALGKHSFQEENVVYPMLRMHGDKAMADKLNHDHGYVKQALHELTMMEKDDPRWIDTAAELRNDLDTHIRQEEDEIFPALHASLSEEQNKHVTVAMNKEGFKLA